MIATCTNPKCGFVFDSPGISIKGATNVTMTNNSTICPKCHSLAKYLDGTFNFDKDGIATVLSGPQITIEILQQLKTLTDKAAKDEITPEQFIEQAKKIHPILDFLKTFIPEDKKEFRSLFIPFLISLILFLVDKCKSDNPSVTNNTYNNTYNFKKEEKPFVQKEVKPSGKKLRITKRF